MKKIITFVVIALLAFVIFAAVAKDTIARISIEKGVEMVTGLPLKMGGLNIELVRTTSIGITDLRLYNPPGFEDKVMLDMPEIFVDYDLQAIIGGKIHLREARIHLKEFVVVKNAKGELNLDALKTVKEEEAVEKKPAMAKKDEAPEFQIDTLQLTIGKVIYKDYSKGTKPSVQEFNIGLDQKFTNINDPAKLVNVIVVKALMNTSIARLTNFDLKSLQGSVGDTLATAQKVIGGAGDTLSKTTAAAGDAAKSTADAVKGFLPFGSNKK